MIRDSDEDQARVPSKSSVSNLLISTVIPVYNSERTLEACVSSVINQSFPVWEVILVDQGSRDRTPQIGRRLASVYQSVRYFDLGLHRRSISLAWNYGAYVAKGDYILFIASDCYLEPTGLLELSKQASGGLKLAGVRGVKQSSLTHVNYLTECRQALWQLSSARSYLEQAQQDFGPGLLFPHFIERDLYLRLGGCDTTLPALEDADFALRCFRYGLRCQSSRVTVVHDQTITVATSINRRIRSYRAARAFERKWSRISWGRRAKVEHTRRHPLVLRWVQGIARLASSHPRLLAGAIFLSAVELGSDIIARIL